MNIVRWGLAAAVFVAAACSPAAPSAEKSADRMRAEFLKAETDGGVMGELFKALRETEPALYERFITIAGEEMSKGKTPFEAGAAARPVYIARFMELLKTAKDEHINQLLAFSVDQFRAAMAIDPMLCVKVTRGEADERINQMPQAIKDRELALMTAVLRAGKQDAAAATEAELQTWMDGFIPKYPETITGLRLIAEPSPTPEQGEQICKANIVMIEAIGQEEPAVSARLFRGTLSLN
jgi:hypothetical protein